MISITLNKQVVLAKQGQTILDVAKKNGIQIPTLCHFPRGNGKDNPRAVCRICIVEVKGRSGMVSACSEKVSPGMEILTHSESVLRARKTIMEFILAENEGATEKDSRVKQLACELGLERSRFRLAKSIDEPSQVKKQLSEYFSIDSSVCVHCDRCIEACSSRNVISRTGFGHKVSTSFGSDKDGIDASNCNYCGDCVEACPAGGISRL